MDRVHRGVIVGGMVVAGLVALAIVAPEIYSGTFSDLGTFLRVLLVVGVLGAWAAIVKRFLRPPWLATVVSVAPILVATWIYVWPYLRPPTEVDEAFPPVEAAPADESSAAADPPPTTAAPSPPPTPTTVAPAAPAESAPSDTTGEPAPTTVPRTTVPPTTVPPTTVPLTTVPPTTVPTGPVELRRSSFQGLTGHRGSGDAALYRLVDGSILLRFEEVDIGSGPELVVYVVPGEDRRGLDGAVRVAGLTAERGNQNYDVPAGVDLTDGTWTVLVWCSTFAVEVANATFTA